MFRKSSLIALALGLTALGSVTVPAAAHTGGTVSLPSKIPSVAGAASMRPSSQGFRLNPSTNVASAPAAGPHPTGFKVPGSVGNASAGSAGQKPDPFKVPGAQAGAGPIASQKPVGLKVPGTQTGGQTGPGPIASQKPDPLKVPMPSNSGNPPAPTPTPTPTPGPSNSGNQGSPSGNGPVVILAPQIPLGMGVSVATPVPVPVTTGAVAQPGPSVIPVAKCVAGNIPALGAAIDALLPTAQLSADDMTRVTQMRALIGDLVANNGEESARDVEQAAMLILGYTKLWLRCGYGTFTWIKQVPTQHALAQ
jgi:hypothetical protein